MAPKSDLAPFWRFVASVWRQLGTSVRCGPRTGRRPLLGRRAIVLAALGLSFSAHAQVDTNRFCRDRNPDGYYDCAWLPSRLGVTAYTIPGPIKAVKEWSEGDVIGQYKGVIAANAGTGLCSAITYELGEYAMRWPELPSGPLTNWELAGFWQLQRKSVLFSYGIKEGDRCAPRTLFTYLYRSRTVGCASGWSSNYDSPNEPTKRFCYRAPFGSQCPVGNPITLGEQNKVLNEFDLPAVAPRSIVFNRTYGSIGHFGIGPREAKYGWEDFGTHWRHNFAGRVEPNASGSEATAARGLKISYFRAGVTRSDGRIDYVPFDRNQRDRLIVDRDANGYWIKAAYITPDNMVEEYQFGRLVRVTTQDGYWQALAYRQFFYSNGDPGDVKLDRIVDAFGRQVSFRYSTSMEPIEGLLISVIDVDGSSVDYAYQWVNEPPAMGTDTYAVNLVSATQRDRSVRRFFYGEAANFPTYGPVRATHLTGLQDELGVRIGSYRYDGSGQAVSTESAGGVNRFQVSSNGYVDPRGTSHSFQSRSAAGLNWIGGWYQPAGAGCGPSNSAITYDANANVASRIDFRGNKTCYANDLGRNLETKRVEGVSTYADCTASLTSPPTGSRVISTQWHPDWRLETRIAEPNKITTITYNGQGATCAPSTVLVDGKPPAVVCSRSEQATTDASGALGFGAGLTGTARTWTYTYTTYGRVLTATDPNGKTTTTTYYPDDDPDMGRRGNVATVTNAANHVTRITVYNLHGQPTQIVAPNGLVTDLTYDLRMRLTSRKVGSELTSFTYDPRGLLTNVAFPDGASLTYTYDAAHRLIAIADHQGSRIDYTLDAMGNRISERATDNGGTLVKNIQRTVDALNRVQQVTGAQ